MDIREAVKARMHALGLNTRQLAMLLNRKEKKKKPRMQSALYAYMNGASLNSNDLEWVLAALGLGVYAHEDVAQAVRDREAQAVNEQLAFRAKLRREREEQARALAEQAARREEQWARFTKRRAEGWSWVDK